MLACKQHFYVKSPLKQSQGQLITVELENFLDSPERLNLLWDPHSPSQRAVPPVQQISSEDQE